MSPNDFGDDVLTACYLIKYMPSTISGYQSPHLKLFLGAFVSSIALIFGYFALFFNNALRIDKLDCKAIENLFSWDI